MVKRLSVLLIILTFVIAVSTVTSTSAVYKASQELTSGEVFARVNSVTVGEGISASRLYVGQSESGEISCKGRLFGVVTVNIPYTYNGGKLTLEKGFAANYSTQIYVHLPYYLEELYIVSDASVTVEGLILEKLVIISKNSPTLNNVDCDDITISAS